MARKTAFPARTNGADCSDARDYNSLMNLTTALLFCMLVAPPALAETFRCGKWVVTPDISVAELTEKCGAPIAREGKVEDIKVRNQFGLMVKTGETVTETWIFDRGPRAAAMVVTIIDGRIKSIERQKE